MHNSIKEARSFSAEAFGHSSPLASPSTATAGSSPAVAGGKARGDERKGLRAESPVSSSRTTPRTASSSSRGRRNLPAAAAVESELPRWRQRDEFEDDEEQFATELDDLEDLCVSLNMRSEERHATPADVDLRPLTGGTSASASTTAPGGSSKDFELASLDNLEESASEVPRDSDNPFDMLEGGQRASYELQQCGSLPHGCRIEKAAGVSAQYFFSVDAAEGPYAPATLTFWIKIFDEFPALDGISIRATKRIFHPNIDQETGRLKVPQLAGSEASCRLKDILTAIRRLVLTPTDSPAVNGDAAMLLQTDPTEFRRTVRSMLGGGEYRGTRFDRVLDFGGKNCASAKGAESEKRHPMSDQLKVDLMKLDVLQAKLKGMADDMIKQNTQECCDLEASEEP